MTRPESLGPFGRIVFIDSRWCHACSSKPLQLCIILKDGVILERFAKRTERNGHLGPEKSRSKIPKTQPKRLLDMLTLCVLRDQSSMRSAHCAYRNRILLACGHRAARSVLKQMPIANRRFGWAFWNFETRFLGAQVATSFHFFCKTY